MPGQSQPHEAAGFQRYVLEGFDGGLHSEESFSKVHILDTECTCAENVEFWPMGTISKRAGRSKMNSTTQLSGAVNQIYEWWSEAGANYLMFFTSASGDCSATIGYFTIGTQTTGTLTYYVSGGNREWNPSDDNIVIVDTYGGSAVFVNGADYLTAFDGVSCSAIQEAPKGAMAVKGYKNYLFVANAEDVGGGTRYQSRIWWSNPGDGHTWPASNYLDLDGDDGDYISGMEVLGNELIVFKERKIFAVTYVGGVYEFYAESRVNGTGCAAQGSILPVYSELLFYGIENFYSFNGRDIESLGDKIKDIITYSIDPGNRTKIRGLTMEDKNQAWWLVPISTANPSGNTHCFILDYQQDAWTVWTNEGTCISWYSKTADLTFGSLDQVYAEYDIAWGSKLFYSNASFIITGTLDGYLMDNGGFSQTSDDGADYTGFWRSKWIDFGFPDITKRIMRITVYIDKEVTVEADDYDLYVNIYKDWDRSSIAYEKTVSVYGTYPVLERRLDFTMQCRSFQIEIGTDQQNEPFTIHRIVIEYVPKGRTLVT